MKSLDLSEELNALEEENGYPDYCMDLLTFILVT
jgi:hypothetical protein